MLSTLCVLSRVKPKKPYEVDTILPILQVNELKHREVKKLAQGSHS